MGRAIALRAPSLASAAINYREEAGNERLAVVRNMVLRPQPRWSAGFSALGFSPILHRHVEATEKRGAMMLADDNDIQRNHMSQQRHDRRFGQVFQLGFSALISGGGFAAFIGLPAFAIFDRVAPFVMGMSLVIFGGFVTVGAFCWDIACNPRWKRRP